MNGGSNIVGLRPGDSGFAERTKLLSHLDLSEAEGQAEMMPVDDSEFAYEAPSMWRWAGPTLAVLIAAAWVGGALYLARDALAAMPPVQLVEFAAALLILPILIGVMWLLLLRTARAEQRRFGKTAEAMRAEARHLDAVVGQLSKTVETNRALLAEQAWLLGDLSEKAQARLGALGRGFADHVAGADAQAAKLAEVADRAEARLAQLLATLPEAQARTEDATRAMEQTGHAATVHAAALDAQVGALAERGRSAEAIASGAAAQLAQHLSTMEATSETAGQRLEQVAAAMSGEIDALLDRTAEAIDQSRQGISAQGEAMLAMIGANQAALDAATRDSTEALADRIGALEVTIARVADRLESQRTAAAALVDGLDGGIADASHRLELLHAQGVERSQLLAASISALGGSADAMTESLRAGETMANTVIGTTESLLIALDAASREIDETLPDALTRLDQRITSSRQVVAAAKPELLSLVTAAESTHDAIEAIAQVIGQQRSTVDQLSVTLLDTLATGRTRAESLGQMVEETIGRTHRFAEDAAPRLVEALLRVRDTAASAADKARDTLAQVIPEAAEAMENATSEAVGRAAASGVEAQLAALSQAADAAVDAAHRASQRLDHQVRAIADSTALVEARLEDARAEREEADQDNMSRRVSLLIESLNSAAIDITRSFSSEVSDSAWAAYLKGDRGVFTRRAVRLLDAGEAREIAKLYDADAPFREQVNRYIHDFEAMLRHILAQREGQHLGVTLLSSDMGKLYVALAQAIERLR